MPGCLRLVGVKLFTVGVENFLVGKSGGKWNFVVTFTLEF
jgi:hypothetical protein